jgi:hypothetical protein
MDTSPDSIRSRAAAPPPAPGDDDPDTDTDGGQRAPAPIGDHHFQRPIVSPVAGASVRMVPRGG